MSEPATKTMNMIEAINSALDVMLAKDPEVVIMGEDVGYFGGVFRATAGLQKKHGKTRVFDTPISECGIIGVGVGMAAYGLRPVPEIQFADYIWPGLNQLFTEVSRSNYLSNGKWPVSCVIRVPIGAYGSGGPYHSSSVESVLANIRGIKVVYPSNPYDAKGLLKSAIRDDDPVIFMESEVMYGDKGEVPDGEYTIPIGVADIKREGTDVTIVSFGKIIKEAYIAADELAKEGISCEIIDLRTVRPMDNETILTSVKKTNRLVILEEAWPFASVSSEIAYIVQERAFDFLDAPIQRITTADTPAPYSPVLLKEWLPNAADVIKAVKKVMNK